MKQLIIFITLILIVLPQINFAEEEVIWETEQIPYLHGVLVAPQGEFLYNLRGKDLQIRRVDDGVVIDSIIMENIPNYLYRMSITDDGRYMAFSGDNPYVIIYDLQERREVKRMTTIAYEREEYGKNVVYDAENWTSSSISPDGTKITGIVTARNGEMTNLIVIDIASEEVLFEQRRIIYDQFNPSDTFYKWHSSEFSPDGNYIFSQLEYREGGNTNAPDSVYIYDVKTLEVYDVVLNSFNREIQFSKYKPLCAIYSGNRILIYDIKNKQIIESELNNSVVGIVFSRYTNQLIYAFDFENHIYDINTKEIIYEYENPKIPRDISLDNTKLISTLYNNIYCLNTYWGTSTVVNNEKETVISPNPTNGFVSIKPDCQSLRIIYQIVDITGQIIEDRVTDNYSNSLLIDFSKFPTGIYFLTINCNRIPRTYKIVNEG